MSHLPTKEHYILGIDAGTTGIRSMLFNRKGNPIAFAYQELPQYFPQPGWVEQDAAEIWQITCNVMAEALKSGKISPSQIQAIGIANQRETTVFWDKSTGEPVCPAIVWQDRRTLPICESLTAQYGNSLPQRTGMLVIPNCAATKIHWMMQNLPSLRQGLEENRLLYGTIDTWLIWKLSGGQLYVTDYSNNSVTLMQNAVSLDYDKPLLDALHIPREILPSLCHSSGIAGCTAKEMFFGEEVPIAGIVGDQQAAAIGQGCLSPGLVKVTYGTGSFMVMNTGDQYIPPSHGMFSPVLWTSSKGHTYSIEGMSDISGAALQWLRDGIGLIRSFDEAEALAAKADTNEGVIFVPAFVGLGAPYMDSYARGSIYGISHRTKREHLCRAALESMAFQARDIFKAMENASAIRLKKLRADGGGAKNNLMLQFQADILGIPVERPAVTETTCLGAAFLAGLATGYWASPEELSRLVRVEKTFLPQISDSAREELCGQWEWAINRTKSSFCQ